MSRSFLYSYTLIMTTHTLLRNGPISDAFCVRNGVYFTRILYWMRLTLDKHLIFNITKISTLSNKKRKKEGKNGENEEE